MRLKRNLLTAISANVLAVKFGQIFERIAENALLLSFFDCYALVVSLNVKNISCLNVEVISDVL
jgi:hypothetical protein